MSHENDETSPQWDSSYALFFLSHFSKLEEKSKRFSRTCASEYVAKWPQSVGDTRQSRRWKSRLDLFRCTDDTRHDTVLIHIPKVRGLGSKHGQYERIIIIIIAVIIIVMIIIIVL